MNSEKQAELSKEVIKRFKVVKPHISSIIYLFTHDENDAIMEFIIEHISISKKQEEDSLSELPRKQLEL